MNVEAIEQAVIAHYRTIQLGDDQKKAVHDAVLDHITALEKTADQQCDKQQAEVERIELEQLRLIQAHGAGAVPLPLLVKEQDRLRRELRVAEKTLRSTQLKFEDIRANFERALTWASDCQTAYQQAPPDVRRQMDQIFFEDVRIDTVDGEPTVVGSTIAEPYGVFLTTKLTDDEEATGATQEAPQNEEETLGRLLGDLRASWRSSEAQAFVSLAQGSKDEVMAGGAHKEPGVSVVASSERNPLRSAPNHPRFSHLLEQRHACKAVNRLRELMRDVEASEHVAAKVVHDEVPDVLGRPSQRAGRQFVLC